jgi:AraC-like DNA-binding protein
MHPPQQESPFDGIHLVDRPWFPYLCTEVEGWEWETQGEQHYNFWVCLSGEGYLSTQGQSFRLKPGMFFIFSPNQRISAAHTAGDRVMRFSAHFIPLSGAVVLDHVPQFPLLGGLVPDLAVMQRQIDRLMRLAFRRKDEIQLNQAMYRLITETCIEGDTSSNRLLAPQVSEAIRVMRADPAAVESMEALAKQLSWSRSHFDRVFQQQVGQAPKQFLLNCKMVEARRYLESSPLRIGEIAEALGYRDPYFFSRQFKQFFAQPPLAYRQSLQHKSPCH